MTYQTITLTVPETLYRRLETQARTAARPVEEVAARVLTRNLPPLVEDELPPALRAELKAMSHLSDESLWQIAESTMNPMPVSHDFNLHLTRTSSADRSGRAPSMWLLPVR